MVCFYKSTPDPVHDNQGAESGVGFGISTLATLSNGKKIKGPIVAQADRFFPSTKKCSTCGKIHDMPLSKRVMKCDCGLKIDKDLNAAINLKNLAVGSTATACHPESSGLVCKNQVKLLVGQEFLSNKDL